MFKIIKAIWQSLSALRKLKAITFLKKKKLHFHFSCVECGKCCYGPGNVYLSEHDIRKLGKFLKKDPKEIQTLLGLVPKNGIWIYKVKSKCVFLTSGNRCSIYAIRPLQCRTYPFWSSHFQSEKEVRELLSSCPGALLLPEKKENYFSPAEIISRCHVTDMQFFSMQKGNPEEYIQL